MTARLRITAKPVQNVPHLESFETNSIYRLTRDFVHARMKKNKRSEKDTGFMFLFFREPPGGVRRQQP